MRLFLQYTQFSYSVFFVCSVEKLLKDLGTESRENTMTLNVDKKVNLDYFTLLMSVCSTSSYEW